MIRKRLEIIFYPNFQFKQASKMPDKQGRMPSIRASMKLIKQNWKKYEIINANGVCFQFFSFRFIENISNLFVVVFIFISRH